MHDTHGRPIEEGDVVAANDWSRGGKRSAFKVVGLIPSSESCNLYGQHFHPQPPFMMTAKETELILKADGSLPPAPAK